LCALRADKAITTKTPTATPTRKKRRRTTAITAAALIAAHPGYPAE
jgi:hypothetical protein